MSGKRFGNTDIGEDGRNNLFTLHNFASVTEHFGDKLLLISSKPR
jgi:hypothetical protein